MGAALAARGTVALSVNRDGNSGGPGHPRHHHPAVLEGLAEALDRVTPELGELVEEQHTRGARGFTIVPLDRTNQGTPGRRGASTTGSGACHTASTLF